MTRFVLIVYGAPPVGRARREARRLLIGNKDNKRGFGALTNPIHDVRIVGEALKAD